MYHSLDKNILVIILKLTKNNPLLELKDLEMINKNRIDMFFQELHTAGITLQPTIDNNLLIHPKQRAQMVIYGAKQGIDFETIIKYLTWQEFELLTTMIGDEFGFYAAKGLNFSTVERKYQIDVILRNNPYVLLIDCKHFGGTGKQSVLREAAQEQITRISALSQEFPKLKNKLQVRTWKQVIFLPLIITWLDDAIFFHDKVPIIPFSKLRSFFQHFHIYLEDM